MNSIPLMFSKKFKWLYLTLCVALLLLFVFLCVQYSQKSKNQYKMEITQPIIALNFDPNSSERNPTGGWIYNIATEELFNLGSIPETVCDFDITRNTLLGIHEDIVTETDIQDGILVSMGPAEYEGSSLVPHTLQYRPQSGDYSALTQSGILVLWDAETESYRELARFHWYKYAFAYSWLEDGKRICIPDSSGIAILDTDTLIQQHWLTIDIPYSNGGSLPPVCKRPFAVSPKGDFLVFCGNEAYDKIMISSIDEQGQLQASEPLTEERYDGQCWFDISPDGKSVVYGVVRIKNALFNPSYYEVWIYHAGGRSKLLESKNSTTSGIGIYW